MQLTAPEIMGQSSDRIDIPGGVYGDLVNYWYSMRFLTGGRSKSELRTVTEMLLPVYVYGRLYEDLPQPVLQDGVYWFASENRELVAYMEDRSGLVGEVVRDFLHMLHDAVQGGVVPAWVLEPSTWEDVSPPTIGERLAPFGDVLSAGLGVGFSKTLVTAGIVVAVVMLGKAVIDKKL